MVSEYVKEVMARLDSAAYTTAGVTLRFTEGDVDTQQLEAYFSKEVTCSVTMSSHGSVDVAPTSEVDIYAFWDRIKQVFQSAGVHPSAEPEQLFDLLDELPDE